MSDDYREYLAECRNEKIRFDQFEEKRLKSSCFENEVNFSIREGYGSSLNILIKYTRSNHIKWTYSTSASYVDVESNDFAIVYVSNTFCIMEIRGNKKKNKIVYKGFIRLNEKEEYSLLPEWKELYESIAEKNDNYLIQNLLPKLRKKLKKQREWNWRKIVEIWYSEAKCIEKQIYDFGQRREYVPISYKRYLYEKYPENWESFGMSGGRFSPR